MLDIVVPGLTLPRGRVLRQLHLPTLKLAQLRLQAGEMNKAEFMAVVRRAVKNMKETVNCFEEIDKEIKDAGLLE